MTTSSSTRTWSSWNLSFILMCFWSGNQRHLHVLLSSVNLCAVWFIIPASHWPSLCQMFFSLCLSVSLLSLLVSAPVSDASVFSASVAHIYSSACPSVCLCPVARLSLYVWQLLLKPSTVRDSGLFLPTHTLPELSASVSIATEGGFQR